MDAINDSSTERANRSNIWEYFEVKDTIERTAECKACRDIFSFKSTVSNLRKHFWRKHGKLNVSLNSESTVKKSNSEDGDENHVEEFEETYLEECSEDDQNNESNSKPKSSFRQVWKYFDVIDESAFKASCRLCEEELSYRSNTGLLIQHMQKNHSDFDCSDVSNTGVGNSGPRSKKASRSRAWRYFTVHDPNARIARCNICGILNSYMTSISNLVKHVKRKHTDVINYDSNQMDDSSDEKSDNPEAQLPSIFEVSLWKYFKKVDNATGLAECLLCKKILCYISSYSILTKHLSRKHPHVTLREASKEKTMFLGGDGQWYEMVEDGKNHADDDDPISGMTEPMEIFLDEANGDVIEKNKIETKLKNAVKKRKRNVATLVVNESSSDEEPLKRRRCRKEDSLDVFGKYLVSLLRDLPEEASISLQGELIKQVIDKKMSLKSDNSSVVVTMAQQEDVVTVPNASDDHIYVVTSMDEQK